nr:hypothetical protein [Tanacetum cinerariifolium]
MPQAKKMFVVRASTMRLGATKAHNLYSKMKGRTQYVHGTSDDFKNHIRDVNAFIGESDAQMLINKMENRKKQEMLDFRTFDSAPKLHTKLTIEIHVCKVYTRTISLLVQKEIYEGCWACQIQEFKKEEGCEIGKIRDIRAGAYRTLYTDEGKETVIQEKDKVVDYKVMRNPEDGSVECTCRHFLQNGYVIEDIYAIKKPKQNLVNNPQKASNKGGRRGEQRKSGREIAMKAKAKRARKCEYCAEKTNKHTKTICPLNPKYIAKLVRIEAVAEQERRTAASATEQEERNSNITHIVDKEQSNTAS